MINKYCRDCIYGAMDINGRVAAGLITVLSENVPRTHGDAEGRDDLTELMNKALMELEDLFRISGDSVEV